VPHPPPHSLHPQPQPPCGDIRGGCIARIEDELVELDRGMV